MMPWRNTLNSWKPLLTAGVLFLCAAGANAETLTLKEAAYVKGPKVLLGEIADIEGENKELLESIEVIDAAQPGSQKKLHAALIQTRLKSAGLEEVELNGALAVTATTLSSEITRDAVAQSLIDHIRETMPWDGRSTLIEVAPPTFDITAPEGQVDFAWAPQPGFDYVGTGAFKGEVLVDGQPARTINMRARIEPYVEVMVATRDIMRGMPVGPMDMEPRKMPLSAAPQGAITDPQRALGLVARKTIFPGQFVTQRDLQERVAVKRNQLVDVLVRSGAVHLKGRAKATMDGRVGDSIILVNPDSNAQMQGMVMADGSVLVE
jgi:flagella basal body P-ring formation protein FlgA